MNESACCGKTVERTYLTNEHRKQQTQHIRTLHILILNKTAEHTYTSVSQVQFYLYVCFLFHKFTNMNTVVAAVTTVTLTNVFHKFKFYNLL